VPSNIAHIAYIHTHTHMESQIIRAVSRLTAAADAGPGQSIDRYTEHHRSRETSRDTERQRERERERGRERELAGSLLTDDTAAAAAATAADSVRANYALRHSACLSARLLLRDIKSMPSSHAAGAVCARPPAGY